MRNKLTNRPPSKEEELKVICIFDAIVTLTLVLIIVYQGLEIRDLETQLQLKEATQQESTFEPN